MSSKNFDDLYDVMIEIREILRSKQRNPEPKGSLPHIAVFWNKYADPKLPKVIAMSPNSTRFRNAVARWKERPDEAFWRGVIDRVNRTDFCLGKNDRKWVADIEFLCRPDTANKIMEGKYGFAGEKKERRVIGHTPDGEPVWGY
jgi:hypothetical protein